MMEGTAKSCQQNPRSPPMQVLPRLSALLADWQPLEEPERGRAEFAAWRPLLESDAQREAIFQVGILLWNPARVYGISSKETWYAYW